jgi:hypothetical protein
VWQGFFLIFHAITAEPIKAFLVIQTIIINHVPNAFSMIPAKILATQTTRVRTTLSTEITPLDSMGFLFNNFYSFATHFIFLISVRRLSTNCLVLALTVAGAKVASDDVEY